MSTSYYPPGWDRERMLNAAKTGQFDSLTEEQRDTWREGFKAEFGAARFRQFVQEMFKHEQEGKGIPKAPPSEPGFMETMRLHERRCSTCRCWKQEWGFVVYKSPEIRGDDPRWKAGKARFIQIVEESVIDSQGFPGLEEVMRRLRFEWVEDFDFGADGEEGVASVAKAYEARSDVPAGLRHSLCLYITPSSLGSILDSPLPSTERRQLRKEIPFVVAVSYKSMDYIPGAAGSEVEGEVDQEEEEEYEGAGWRGFFNVAVETLLDSLFPAIADQMMTPWRIGGHVEGGDIWCWANRYGVHKAGVGYWDKRTRSVPM
ncbi:hypothetical protein B0H66DRAFT_569511 [Apodospora peruviana]|uniref:Uncharacterized protein n=1 Tax=Apodospora peruviana TaxID=516989 RepID=A0AAE0LZ76_9PEZI|nr:hypothetical protein B0H66DRAFT_569511 [Apodospora peruviana]